MEALNVSNNHQLSNNKNTTSTTVSSINNNNNSANQSRQSNYLSINKPAQEPPPLPPLPPLPSTNPILRKQLSTSNQQQSFDSSSSSSISGIVSISNASSSSSSHHLTSGETVNSNCSSLSTLQPAVTSSSHMFNDTDSSSIYTVLYDYLANHDDELTLIRGDSVRVLSKDYKVSGDDGWWTGINLSDGKKGIFPYNYVELLVNNNKQDPRQVDHQDYDLIDFSDDNQLNNNDCRNRRIINPNRIANTESTEGLSSIILTTGTSNSTSTLTSQINETDTRELPPHIPYSELEFKEGIGAGGFGKVYRGYWSRETVTFDESGTRNSRKVNELVAIKEARVEGDKEDLLATVKQNVLQEANYSGCLGIQILFS